MAKQSGVGTRHSRSGAQSATTPFGWNSVKVTLDRSVSSQPNTPNSRAATAIEGDFKPRS